MGHHEGHCVSNEDLQCARKEVAHQLLEASLRPTTPEPERFSFPIGRDTERAQRPYLRQNLRDTVGELTSAEICVSHMPSLKATKLGKLAQEKFF
jgi:hypothetical protein